MELVFWIDQNTFASKLLEKVFKKQNLGFYTLENVRDFSYLVIDLKPTMIVLDEKTAQEGLEELKKQFQATPEMQKLPYVIVGETEEFSFLNVVGSIKRPFDPYKIPELLKKFQQ